MRKVKHDIKDCDFAVYEAIKSLKNGDKLIFEKGEYHFFGEFAKERASCISNHDNDGYKKTVFSFENFENITIDGNGSKFIFHGIISPFEIVNSKNITLRNFAIDYPDTMYVGCEVIENGEKYSLLKPDNPQKLFVKDNRLWGEGNGYAAQCAMSIEIDPETDDIAYNSGDNVFGKWFEHMDVYAEECGDNIKLYGDDITRIPKGGNRVLFGLGKRFFSGILLEESEDIKIENVTINHCLGMGILAQLCKDIHIERLKIMPSGQRWISAFADAIHFVECKGDILIENCFVEKQMDDAVNCHGIYCQIKKVIDEKKVAAELVHNQQLGIKVLKKGDRIEVIERDTMLTKGESIIEDIEYLNRNVFIVTFKNNVVDLSVGDSIENVEHCPNITIRKCNMQKNRARCLLISTRGSVLVENNIISSNGPAIHIPGDNVKWFESGKVEDVKIFNNKFINCNRSPAWGKALIAVNPRMKSLGEGFYHKSIIIENNDIYAFSKTLLSAKSVERLIFKNNKIIESKDFSKIDGELFEITHCGFEFDINDEKEGQI